MSSSLDYVKSNESTNDYEPFMIAEKQVGEVHWLTQTNSNDEPTYSGYWRCEPIQFAYTFPGDEIFQVLEGELLVELSNGDNINLAQGDIVSFKKGLNSTWTVKSSFKKFFVISNC